ncbi:sialidase family protein [Marinimicrobium alkaliphilum]|uniref:sialidase family protein n=1 Tax=Marinimicrobium alkaliphilum TaxID=2202654 RepID=UPI0013005CAB|nr:sialidase family protein [Marinimicrobium alkaliphilum]
MRSIPSLIVCSILVLAACGNQASEEPARASTDSRWQAPTRVAEGPASTGPWRMNDSEFHYLDDATVALLDDNELVVVWADNERQTLYLQRYDADNQPRFDDPVSISRSPSVFSWLPRVAFTDDDHIYVLWEEIVFSGGSHGGDIFFARSRDGGRSFDEPLNLSRTPEGAGKGRLTENRWDNGSLDLRVAANGDLLAAWSTYEGGLYFRRSVDQGQRFLPRVTVSASEQYPARAPALAEGPDGTYYLAWAVGEDPGADLRLARSGNQGETFGPPRTLLASAGHSDTPALGVDSRGQLHLAYAESPDGPFGPAQIHYAQLNGDGDVLKSPRRLSNPEDSTQSGRAPSLALDPEDRLAILWEHQPDPGNRPRGLGIVFSPDAGERLTPMVVIPGSDDAGGGVNGSLQGQLARKLSMNSNGQVAVVNSHFLPDDYSRIVLLRGSAPDP